MEYGRILIKILMMEIFLMKMAVIQNVCLKLIIYVIFRINYRLGSHFVSIAKNILVEFSYINK
jgi:hypothetical protein